MVRCADNSLYCGQTTDLKRRVEEHNSDDKRSAKYTKSRRPVKLVHSEQFTTASEALKREYEVKQWSKLEKEKLVSGILKIS
jgi:putative endonuclease